MIQEEEEAEGRRSKQQLDSKYIWLDPGSLRLGKKRLIPFCKDGGGKKDDGELNP